MRPVAVLREVSWRRPEWWVAATAILAWAGMAVGTGGLEHVLGLGETSHGLADAAGHSALMSIAMMAPLVLPTVRHVALSSMWDRRHRSAAGFLTGYLGLWAVVSTALLLAGDRLAGALGRTTVVAGAFIVAAAWQVAAPRRRFLRRCRLTVPLAPRGWKADRDCMRYGIRVGMSCVATCWALMTAASATHGTIVMLGLLTVQFVERCYVEPRPRRAAAAILALGVAVVAGRVLLVNPV